MTTASHTRADLARFIAARLTAETETARACFSAPRQIGSFWVDDLLPEQAARAIAEAFPETTRLTAKNTLRERKHVGVAMDAYAPLIAEITYAFQDPSVVAAVAAITTHEALEPDPDLYAGGISAMETGAYLRPHLDNSHDAARERWRAFNLLYYVTPEWADSNGGALELWDEGPARPPRAVPARFNRLVVMETNARSWHSVSPVNGAGVRRCVSNYYFSPRPPDAAAQAHVTSFRGRHDEPLVDLALRLDGAVRGLVRRVIPGGIAPLKHVYRKAAKT